MKGVSLSLVAGTLLLAACDNAPTALTRPASPTTSRAALVANNRVDVNTVALSDCGGEDVLVTGNFHQVLTITVDNAGGFHVNNHLDFTGLQGVGVVTGTQYVAHQVQMINFNVSKDLIGVEVTQPLVFTLIGRGSAPNEVFVAIQHFTINANGEFTSFVDNFRVKCS